MLKITATTAAFMLFVTGMSYAADAGHEINIDAQGKPATIIVKDDGSVPCDRGNGVIFEMKEGASVVGPVSMKSTSGNRTDPDGTTHTDYEDDLVIAKGMTLTGPLLFCTRPSKPLNSK